MRKSLIIILSIITFCILSIPVYSLNPVIIYNNTEYIQPGLYLEIFEDRGGELTIDEVASSNLSGNFIPSNRETPCFGYTDSSCWIKFSILNRKALTETEEWLLEAASFPDIIELYIPQPSGKFYLKRISSREPMQNRDVRHRHPVFKIPIHPVWHKADIDNLNKENSATFYMRFKAKSYMNLPLSLWSQTAFLNRERNVQLFLGLFLGVLFIMLLYNLFICFSVWDISHLYYVLYLMFFTLFYTAITSLIFEYILPSRPLLANQMTPFFLALTVFWSIKFSQSFLQTREQTPVMHIVLTVLLILSVYLTFLSIFIACSTSIKINTFLALFTIPVIILTGTRCLLQKYRPARFFLAAWLFFLSGAVIILLKNFGILQAGFIANYGFQIGTAVGAVLLSIALADRVNYSRAEMVPLQYEI